MGKGHAPVIAKIARNATPDKDGLLLQLEELEILDARFDDKVAEVRLVTPGGRAMYLTRVELEKFSADLATWLAQHPAT